MIPGTRNSSRHVSSCLCATGWKYSIATLLLSAPQDQTFIAYNKPAGISHLSAFGQAIGAGWTQSTVVPDEFAGGHFDTTGSRAGLSGHVTIGLLDRFITRRKLVSDSRNERVCLAHG